MKVKYLRLKVGTILATMAATPVLWAALAYPEWQANSGAIAGEVPSAGSSSDATTSRVIIVPRYVDARTGEPLDAASPLNSPAGDTATPAPQQPIAAAPPPQTQRSQPAAPARSSATTRGS